MSGPAPPPPRPVRARLRRLMGEPLPRFLAIGALVFAADRGLAALRARDAEAAADAGARTIVVSDGFVAGLRARHRERTGREPDGAEEAALVQEHVREEALYREARAAGLDVGDPIVRRRLVQKMEFVLAGRAAVGEPSDAELERFVAEHEDELALPARTRLVHVFFSRELRAARAEEDARAALALLRADPDRVRPEALGDPFLRGHELGPASDVQLAATLGDEAPAALAALEAGAWAGPIPGALGLHLVLVRERLPARRPDLEEVRARVRGAWLEAETRAAVEREIEQIVAGYRLDRQAGP